MQKLSAVQKPPRLSLPQSKPWLSPSRLVQPSAPHAISLPKPPSPRVSSGRCLTGHTPGMLSTAGSLNVPAQSAAGTARAVFTGHTAPKKRILSPSSLSHLLKRPPRRSRACWRGWPAASAGKPRRPSPPQALFRGISKPLGELPTWPGVQVARHRTVRPGLPSPRSTRRYDGSHGTIRRHSSQRRT